jgi:DNA polymerase III subunit gamma/tau
MSYLVFARKWRPTTFEEVVGQDHVTQTLIRAIEKNRVAHAYIFTGTRGVGKTTMARILARALNCEKGPTAHPCGVCESCKSILAGSSFDVLEIDGASNNSVDDVRELRENISYSSMSGKYRIYVIDEVHMLTKPAFNALLKTLEEPPPKVIFIFATTEPHKIPQTIQSRCQRYDFRRISSEKIGDQLAKICAAEKIVCDRTGLDLIANKADGSMRDALSLLDQVFSYGKETFTEEDVRTVLGVVHADVYKSIIQAAAQHNPKPVLDAVQDVLANGLDLSEFIIGLAEYIRDLIFSKVPGLLQHAAANHDEASIKAMADSFSERTLLRMAELVKKSEQELKYSSFPRFLVESMLLKLVYLDDSVALEHILKSLGSSPASAQPAEDVKKKVAPAPEAPPFELTSEPAPIPSAPQVKPAVPQQSYEDMENLAESATVAEGAAMFESEEPTLSGDVQKDWPEFLHHLVEDWPRLGAFLSVAQLVSGKGNTVELRFGSSYQLQFDEVTQKKNRDHILQELEKFNKRPVDLHMTIEPKKHTPLPSAPVLAKENAQQSIQDDMEREPIIQQVLEYFDGEVIS